MTRDSLRLRAGAFARHGGVAGVAVTAAGIMTGAPTVVAIGLLVLVIAAYTAIYSRLGSF